MDRHKTYLGTPTPGREPAIVYVDEKGEGHILPKYTEHAHYADQFGWGTNGPRCTQLAFAILTNHFNGDHHRARLYCHAFKYRTLREIPHSDSWEINTRQIDLVLSEIRQEDTFAPTTALTNHRG